MTKYDDDAGGGMSCSVFVVYRQREGVSSYYSIRVGATPIGKSEEEATAKKKRGPQFQVQDQNRSLNSNAYKESKVVQVHIFLLSFPTFLAPMALDAEIQSIHVLGRRGLLRCWFISCSTR